jgi:hypothetical protein
MVGMGTSIQSAPETSTEDFGRQPVRIGFLMLAAILLVGIGYLAILPPFEGFDEYVHYSSVRQVADTRTVPIFGRSFIDQTVVDYASHGPMPWSSGAPPFAGLGHMTYPSFFANPAAVAHYEVYRISPPQERFTPGADENYEAQHPPLYYLLMAAIMRAADGFSFVDQILILRLVSYILAWTGFALGWYATQSYSGKPIPQGAAIGYLFFPFVVPMFFSEFARIGNDSLCLFLLGLAYILSLAVFYRDDGGVAKPVTLGVILGLGLLTKAFFIPIIAGYSLFIALRAWQVRHLHEMLCRQLSILGLVIVPALILGGGWYVYDFIAYGSPTGSAEAIWLAQNGGLFSNLLQKFSVYVLIHNVIAIAVSWSWAGSWSLVRMSPVLHFPLLLVTGWILANYLVFARRYDYGNPIWLPVWLVAPFLGGLLYHALVVIAEGTGGTPGWYLHILAPFLALAMGYGIECIRMNEVGRLLLVPALAYSFLFLLLALWSQMALFAGCAIKNEEKLYQFSGPWFCLDRVSEVAGRVGIVGWPLIAALSIGCGFFCLLIGFFSAVGQVRSSDPGRPS